MRKVEALAAAAMSGMLCAAGCGESPTAVAKSANGAGEQESKVADEGDEVRNLPYARGRSFQTLDEYLAHLERQAAIDLPYWRRVGPDLYEWVRTRVPRGPPERATRAELMRRYGFTR